MRRQPAAKWLSLRMGHQPPILRGCPFGFPLAPPNHLPLEKTGGFPSGFPVKPPSNTSRWVFFFGGFPFNTTKHTPPGKKTGGFPSGVPLPTNPKEFPEKKKMPSPTKTPFSERRDPRLWSPRWHLARPQSRPEAADGKEAGSSRRSRGRAGFVA